MFTARHLIRVAISLALFAVFVTYINDGLPLGLVDQLERSAYDARVRLTMPVMDHGKLTGYRIYPSGNPSAFNQLGLRPGDVVTSVNGIPLTDPAQSMRVLSSLKTSEQISIGLVRNGQVQTQVLQMPPPGLQENLQQQQDTDDNSDDENPDDSP